MSFRLPFFSLLIALLLGPATVSTALDDWYSDVEEHHMYFEGIYEMSEKNVVSGYEDGSFKPMNEVNRMEALKMILVATGATQQSDFHLDIDSKDLDFTDIEEDAWYLPYLAWGLEHDVISENKENLLRPGMSINRAEALKILITAAGKKSELPSIESDEWFTAYLQYGIDHSLITPDAYGDYHPEAVMTRGELCDLLYRFMNAPYTGVVEYGIASYYGWNFDGRNTASGTLLDAYGYMAAHKTLPFGTKIKVTSLSSEKSIVVEVVDRGPYTEGYIVDLTPAAFEVLGSLPTGILRVRVEVLTSME